MMDLLVFLPHSTDWGISKCTNVQLLKTVNGECFSCNCSNDGFSNSYDNDDWPLQHMQHQSQKLIFVVTDVNSRRVICSCKDIRNVGPSRCVTKQSIRSKNGQVKKVFSQSKCSKMQVLHIRFPNFLRITPQLIAGGANPPASTPPQSLPLRVTDFAPNVQVKRQHA